MAWTAEDRRKYAPMIQEIVRQGMIVRLARTMDMIDPQPKVGRERVWSALIMLQALWHLARDGCTWRRLPAVFPPFTTVWSRLCRWRALAVLDRALAVLVACLRLARGRKRRPTAAIIDTQSVRTRPQRGPRGYDAARRSKAASACCWSTARVIRLACASSRPTCTSTGRCAPWPVIWPPIPRCS